MCREGERERKSAKITDGVSKKKKKSSGGGDCDGIAIWSGMCPFACHFLDGDGPQYLVLLYSHQDISQPALSGQLFLR